MPSSPTTPENASTVAELIRIVDAIDRAVDAKDWAAARSYFADELTVDFQSLSGQPAARIAADGLVGAWATNLTAAKTSLHMRSNHQVFLAEGQASVVSAGYAFNRMEGAGDPLWEVWGTYEHSLAKTEAGWKVDGMKLTVAHQRGNMWVRDTVPAPDANFEATQRR